MLISITSARLSGPSVPGPSVPRSSAPGSSAKDAKADAETLAWFGTAYGRRFPIENRAAILPSSPALLGGTNLPVAVDFGKAKGRAAPSQRSYAPIVVLGATLIALFVLRTMPVAPPPILDPVRARLPVAADPQIEASQHVAPGLPATPSDGDRLAHEASEAAGTLAAARQEPQHPNLQSPLPPAVTPSAVLPPPVPLSPALAPDAEARPAAAPALASVPRPEAVAVADGGFSNLQPSPVVPLPVAPSPVVNANLLAPQRPVAAPFKPSGNPDLAAGRAHFATGDLPAARAAFARALDAGLPDAALALGNTFDPVSLAKVGVKEKGDPALARQWYRRAFELAMRRPGRRGP